MAGRRGVHPQFLEGPQIIRGPPPGHHLQGPPVVHGPVFQGPPPIRGHTIIVPSSQVAVQQRPQPAELQKIQHQHQEIQHLAGENQRLAATHVALRQELAAAQSELQAMQQRLNDVQADKEVAVRGLLDRIGKLEAELRAVDQVKADLHQTRLELQAANARRQEGEQIRLQQQGELQRLQADMQRSHVELQQVPAMRQDIESLRQEVQLARTALEATRKDALDLQEAKSAAEKNLVSMAREVEKLTAQLMASKGNPGISPYSSFGVAPPDVGYGASSLQQSFIPQPQQQYAVTPYSQQIQSSAELVNGSGGSFTSPGGGRNWQGGESGGKAGPAPPSGPSPPYTRDYQGTPYARPAGRRK
eukprot:TRINITY_DN549_c0_g1_i1.p1 TRINITY_DN549_c0_g1~~TRINITY_DN549_c0_g1_i1.p1  ORF type:complete len:375 (+),score=63.41 TRINITY_DN549_c0_g1_i1:46-1125(+)